MTEKESLELATMWHVDALLQVFPITIVTTIDREGRINAAPYSLLLFKKSPDAVDQQQELAHGKKR